MIPASAGTRSGTVLCVLEKFLDRARRNTIAVGYLLACALTRVVGSQNSFPQILGQGFHQKRKTCSRDFLRRCQIIFQHFGFARRRFSFRRRRCVAQNFDPFVESIPLPRSAAGLADGFDHFGFGLQHRLGRVLALAELRRGCAGVHVRFTRISCPFSDSSPPTAM